MSRTKRKPTQKERTIAVPLETHNAFKAEGDRRGMKLREVPSFLRELLEVTTPEQQSAAYSRYVERRGRERTPAHA